MHIHAPEQVLIALLRAHRKEKEAAEARQKQEELDAANAYKDFVQAFDGPDTSSTPGGSVRAAPKAFVKAGGAGETYNPLASTSSAKAPPTGPRSTPAAAKQAMAFDDEVRYLTMRASAPF